NANAQLCLGSQYRLLRREFSQTPTLPVSQRQSLTINFGGSDPKHFTLPVLKAISESLANTPIRVVTGPGFIPLESLQHFIQQSPSPIQHIHNCQDMADVWIHSRLTIAAAGGAQFELAACQSPSVLVVVADNQLNATREASQQGWCDMWDARKSLSIPQLVDKVLTLWNDEARLEKMHMCAAQFSFVTGADTLLDALNH
ncbi:glycosyltransferase, partial [uncultured Alteromonas sp.]|uniref:glycosyltransferase n=1 Tax=uncultured Alteromonas sp. TaxID=179113 RepID=UPI0030D9EB43